MKKFNWLLNGMYDLQKMLAYNNENIISFNQITYLVN